ncbi:MAG: hypothetical protein HC802_11820 [Caldilineaceae bacterium]|nr:hypothetical protein [Caldilineaceae bacterium]
MIHETTDFRLVWDDFQKFRDFVKHKENIEAALAHVVRIKPSSAKGQYIKRICLAATRTPSVTIEYVPS